MSNSELVFPLPIKAVVIDLDGTLLHTAPDLAEASNRMLAELGMPPVAEETVKSYIGNGVAQLIKRVLTGTMHGEPDPELFERARKIYDRHYSEVFSLYSRPFPDVVEGLEAFKKAGYRMGCITNKIAKYTEPLLKDTGLHDYFELVLSGDTLPKMKPDPMQLLHACEEWGITPDQMLLIGDSGNDTQAARAAGCHVFCVPYGYNHGQHVHEMDLDAVVSGLLEASTLIRKA
ncbi:MAG TPA: phosphoglycolate phosphatase [Methylophilaceae bacterium]|nr:phosphoglycolate phosphatase [Methylophilaceae bacterium]